MRPPVVLRFQRRSVKPSFPDSTPLSRMAAARWRGASLGNLRGVVSGDQLMTTGQSLSFFFAAGLLTACQRPAPGRRDEPAGQSIESWL
jgi:hypothetical protein